MSSDRRTLVQDGKVAASVEVVDNALNRGQSLALAVIGVAFEGVAVVAVGGLTGAASESLVIGVVLEDVAATAVGNRFGSARRCRSRVGAWRALLRCVCLWWAPCRQCQCVFVPTARGFDGYI